MGYKAPKSREDCIRLIDGAGKREEFVEIFTRTPEEYLDEYAYHEPDIWTNILNDLEIS